MSDNIKVLSGYANGMRECQACGKAVDRPVDIHVLRIAREWTAPKVTRFCDNCLLELQEVVNIKCSYIIPGPKGGPNG